MSTQRNATQIAVVSALHCEARARASEQKRSALLADRRVVKYALPAEQDRPLEVRTSHARRRAEYLPLLAAGVALLAGCYAEHERREARTKSTAVNAVSAELTKLVLHDPFLISDPARTAGPPSVRFVDDAWRVAWTSGEPEATALRGYHVEVAKIAANTITLRSELASDEFFAATLALAADGRVGVLTGRGGCKHRVFDPDLRSASEPFALGCECSEGPAAVAIDGSSDWLLGCHGAEIPSRVLVGRYTPELARWTSAPQQVGGSDYTPINVFARGSDAVVLWSNGAGRGSTARSMQDLARMREPPAAAVADHAIALRETAAAESGYAIAQLDDRTLVVGTNGQRLWSAALSQTEVLHDVELASTAIGDRPPAAVSAEERAVIGVCYATGRGPYGGSGDAKDGVSFVVLDADGEPRLPPVVIAEDLTNIGGCGVAWSGSEFLVVYWHIDYEGLAGARAASVIQGRRISVE